MFQFTHIAAFYRSMSRLHTDCPACEDCRQRAMIYDWTSSPNFYPERELDTLDMN